MHSLRDIKGYDDLPPDLKAASEAMEAMDANRDRMKALPLLDAAPDQPANAWGVDFPDSGAADLPDGAWTMLGMTVPPEADLIGARSFKTPDGLRHIEIYSR